MAVKVEKYINRELSWMDFNYRVLEEAFKKDNPIMEKLKFLAITCSNLDEFFMVRVAGVKAQIASEYMKEDASGLSPTELFDQLSEKIAGFCKQQYSCYTDVIVPLLEKEGLYFLKTKDMNKEQLDFISDYYEKVVFPVLTPLAVDSSRPLPTIANKSLNLLVRLKEKETDEEKIAFVRVPAILPRFLEVPSDNGRAFVLLEDIISYKIGTLFELYNIKACCPFRITRDSDLEIDEEAEDLLIEIQNSIKKRKSGAPVRLEILKKTDAKSKKFLQETLNIADEDIYVNPGPIDLTFLSKFTSVSAKQSDFFKPIIPVNPPADFVGSDNIFDTIKERDRMVHHPYESFDAVVDFVKSAAEDENVLAIKQTLYRVSGHSPIIDALMKAAENGKQVTVLVELKARFDEENNIAWAKRLEMAGCHVIYGLAGLKTHCKICLVVRKEGSSIKRYLHLSTGNYNYETAKTYTDIGMFTCNEAFGSDASSLFNVLTGYSHYPDYKKLIVAPEDMRTFFEDMIKNEIENSKKGLPAGIDVKMNSLVDPEIINLLYKASQAGVKINLLVRGICCLVAGVPGLSENITVTSIVGHLLEHSRIFIFKNKGHEKIYIGSADWMPRNLNRRVELVFPVEDETLRTRVLEMMDIMFKDNINARKMLPDGTYEHVKKEGDKVNSQRMFANMAKKEQKLQSGKDNR